MDNKLHELSSIDNKKLAYSKSMSKVLFGSLDTRNQVDVVLSVTPFMSETFKTYPLDHPTYHRLSWNEETRTIEVQQIVQPKSL